MIDLAASRQLLSALDEAHARALLNLHAWSPSSFCPRPQAWVACMAVTYMHVTYCFVVMPTAVIPAEDRLDPWRFG